MNNDGLADRVVVQTNNLADPNWVANFTFDTGLFILMVCASCAQSLTAQTLEPPVDLGGYADRVVISNAGGAARWAVDTSGPAGFGDEVEDAAVLFGLPSDIHLLGDMNGDGQADRVVVIDANGNPNWQVDFSENGIFGDGNSDLFQQHAFGTAGDEFLLADIFITSIPGDFDGNGLVDGNDLTDPVLGWQARFGADLDGTGFLVWQWNFGAGVPLIAAAVPEPNSLVLLTILALLIGTKRNSYNARNI